MRLRGSIRNAWIEENPPLSGTIEMVLRVIGDGADGPEALVVPSDLLSDPRLEPASLNGRGFEAEVEEARDGRWIVRFVQFEEVGLIPHS